LRYNSPDILLQAVISILHSCVFFDDVKILVFILYSVKKAITILESRSYILANCFCELIYLGVSINKLSLNNHSIFHKQCIIIFNKRELLLAADDIFKKIGKSNILRHSFPKGKDYLVQLALKLFSIVLHAAGCEQLPYFEVEKTNSEVFEILIDEYLNLDEDDFVEITEVDLNESEENTNLSEESNLLLNNILNLDKFENEFEEDDLSIDEDYYDEYREETFLANQLQEDIDWNPIEEVEKIIEN
ncbi:4845_t:CDS:2, partial [Scutellospora calospora]